MGPQRKKSKPNPEASSSQSPSTPQHQTHSHSQSPEEQSQKPPAQNSTKADTDVTTTDPHSQSGKHSTNLDNSSPNGTRPTTAKSEKAPARNSWYNGGSWRAKASPVAQATRESISVAGGATTEALAEGSNQAGRYMHNTLRRSSTFSTKSLAIAASETRVNATGSTGSTGTNTDPDKTNADTTMKPRPRSDGKERPEKIQEDANNHGTDESIPRESGQEPVPEPPLPPIPASENDAASGHSQKPSQSSASWLGWWSRPDGYATGDEKPPQPDIVEAHSTPLPPTPGPAPTNDADTIKATDGDTTPPMSINADQNSITPSNKMEYGSTRSWFGLWSSTQNQEADQPDIQPTEPQQPPDATVPADPPAIEQAKDTPETQKTYSSDNKIKDASPKASSSGWAFWSREQIDELSSTPNGTQRHIGELAVADTPSQSHPEAAQFNEGREQKSKTNQVAKSGSVKEVTRDRSSTLDDASSKLQAKVPSQAGSKSAEAAKALEATKAAAAKGLKPQSRPNLILPSFRDTYSTAYIPSYWERLTQYVGSSLRLVDMPADERHVSITPTLPKVKNAIAIGVHGYFPAPLIQKVLGQPTGTSIRFANYASAAIKNWTEQNQPDTPCEIETVALEGEGFILDRVNTLWKLLLNWLSHLRQADLILVACHSQGVPVAIMLVSKLIQLGCLSPTAKIGICAMAGVNLGPFADYKSRLLGGGSAAELFEFSKPGSKVSQDYANALDVVLRHSVRITYCGSLDDQLVPLESSTFATLSHPYVYRCVFVDGRVHAPDFITALVAFALKLRNLGISDHGLIRELSLPLAGSLYGGEGHSRVYDDPAVYKLALEFTLETTSLSPPSSTATAGSNASQAGVRPTTDQTTERRTNAERPMPSSVSAANAMRRGSVSATALPGISPVLAPYETLATGANANPFFLPWAMRGIMEEEVVKRDMGDQIRELLDLFEEWRPVSKVLKDVRFRLEGVRSKM